MSDTLHLGSVITTPQARDATHIAVAPVASHERLSPGQHIGFLEDSTTHVSSTGALHGIVDPFLKDDVRPNQQFWMFLYPGTITGLRHEWTHACFPKVVSAPSAKVSVAPAVMPTVSGGGLCCPSEEEEVYECCPEPKSPAVRLREIADLIDIEYHRLLSAAAAWLGSEKYEVQIDSENWRSEFPQYAEEFWELYAELTGRDIPADKRTSFFLCSC